MLTCAVRSRVEEWRCSTLLSDRAGIYFVNKLRKVAFCAQERSLKDKQKKKKSLKAWMDLLNLAQVRLKKPLSQQADVLPANNDAAALKHWRWVTTTREALRGSAKNEILPNKKGTLTISNAAIHREGISVKQKKRNHQYITTRIYNQASNNFLPSAPLAATALSSQPHSAFFSFFFAR